MPLRALGIRIPDEMLAQMRFGRALDNRLYKATGFSYDYTTRETVQKLAAHQRLHPVLRDGDRGYRYEREVEDFLRRSPLVEPREK
jgi:UDP-glucose 4-epimerase